MRRDRQSTSAREALAKQHAAESVARFEARMSRLSDVRRRERQQASGWIILRTSAKATLKLAASLDDAGIDAWTPGALKSRRLPRGRKACRIAEEPIVPSFVFVRADALPDVVRALVDPLSPHPRFTLFRHNGRTPVIADRSMADLRQIEDAAYRQHLSSKPKPRVVVPIGTVVPVREGPFAGLEAVVEEVRGGKAVVCIGGCFRAQVETWHLVGDRVSEDFALRGEAA